MSINNLENRLKLLYTSINCHFGKFKRPEPIGKESIDDEGKSIYTVSIGGGITTEDEVLNATNDINIIIHNIANLKDNLKNLLKSKKINDKIVENYIDSSIHLKVIIDLANQEKHGYPTNSRRSKLDPKIVNIQNEMIINFPLSKVFVNILDSRVEIAAEIVDYEDKFLFTFKELVEKSIEKWEDFFLEHLIDESLQIKEKRAAREETKLKIKQVQDIIDKAFDIFENSQWTSIGHHQLVLGMIVQYNNAKNNVEKGVIRKLFYRNSILMIEVFGDNPLWPVRELAVKENNWKYINLSSSDDVKFLFYYYQNFHSLVNSIKNLQ